MRAQPQAAARELELAHPQRSGQHRALGIQNFQGRQQAGYSNDLGRAAGQLPEARSARKRAGAGESAGQLHGALVAERAGALQVSCYTERAVAAHAERAAGRNSKLGLRDGYGQ